jgi:SAM-dependent methyltransferase
MAIDDLQAASALTAPGPTADPDVILQLASGFMAAKHLFAANELGLFEALADSPARIEGLAARCGLTTRAARISADAMVALGMLERDGDTYRNGPAAATFLSGCTPADLRLLLRFWDKISYPTWETLADALATGPTRELSDVSGELQELAQAGIEAATAGALRALIETIDFSDTRRLLDVGGGTGSWTVGVAGANPHLHATVVDLPTVAPIATDRIVAAGLADRVTFASADALHDPLPTGHDVCIVANLIHYFSPEQNRTLLAQIRAAVEPRARLLIADFWTNPTHTEPLMAALMAGEFAVHIAQGDVYSVEEGEDWLAATGWALIAHQPLAGPFSLVVAEPQRA